MKRFLPLFFIVLLFNQCGPDYKLYKEGSPDISIHKKKIVLKKVVVEETEDGTLKKFIIPTAGLSDKRPVIRSLGCEGYEYLFNFKDSVIVYFSTVSTNSGNIKSCKPCYLKWCKAVTEKTDIVQNNILLYCSASRNGKYDAVTVEGQDKNGLYWKERVLPEHFFIGYYNVKAAQKQTYDSIIKNARFGKMPLGSLIYTVQNR